MNEQMQAFLNNLIKTQFADLKGSWANLQLQLSEKALNELLALALASQKEANPWLRLVQVAQVKGKLAIELKLTI